MGRWKGLCGWSKSLGTGQRWRRGAIWHGMMEISHEDGSDGSDGCAGLAFRMLMCKRGQMDVER